MTQTYSSARSVLNAKNDVGFHEGDNNWNPYSWWQYGDAREPWCDSAVCKWSYDAGYRFLPNSTFGAKGFSYVPTHRQHAIAEGIWRDKHSYTAHPGDLIVYDWEGDGTPDHIEMNLSDAGPGSEQRTGKPRFATIGGNTGDMVAYRTRYESTVVGIIALTQAGQNEPGSVLPSKEFINMGMTAACSIPGAHGQGKAPWTGRMPFVGALLQPNGTTDIVGFNGASLKKDGAVSAFGVSIKHEGRLVKPIRAMSPGTDKEGNYNGSIIGLAEDGGTFVVHPEVHYL